ncbi:MAG: phosphate propanoyltransferase [Elusimicrobia bacterium]|nr:phosphate propanoyltransferase [Elusimicrobiota bacterium]
MKFAAIVNISNRHIHLAKEHVEALFGKDYKLTALRDLMQPGEYACNETVTIRGPKSEIQKVRVLGPVRPKTQVEICLGDSIKLGIDAHVRLSGDLEGSAPITIVGPVSTLELPEGCIIAKRHVHMSTADAEKFGIKNLDVLSVKAGSAREVIFNNVIARVSFSMKLECHLDIEEANAAGVKNGTPAEIISINGNSCCCIPKEKDNEKVKDNE